MTGHRWSAVVVLALSAVVVVGTSAPAWASVTARPRNVTVYLAPASKGGKDTHTGLRSSSPILTLARAQQVLKTLKPTGNVTVRIEQGTYSANAITWSFYVPGHTVSFMPANYAGGGRPPGGDPVFTDPVKGGRHIAQTWFTAVLPGPGTPLHNGGSTGLRFYYLQIQDYTQAISFNGQAGHSYHNKTFYIQASAGVDDNSVFGMTFKDIGSLYAPGQTGYGVILFTESSHDTIANDTFDDIYNTGDHDELHALYITHFSSDNTVDRNLFEDTNGEPVKVRDRSNYNDIYGNRFIGTGGVSAYLDLFCTEACAASAKPKKWRECASYGNRFADNTITNGPQWELSPPGETYAGGPGCTIPRGVQRVHAVGNVR